MSVEPSVTFALTFLGALYALVVLCVVLVIVVALYRIPIGHSDSIRELFRLTRFLELTTVLVIIISATFLGVLGLLKSEGVAAILGGIAGYVLGGRSAQRPLDEEKARKAAEEKARKEAEQKAQK